MASPAHRLNVKVYDPAYPLPSAPPTPPPLPRPCLQVYGPPPQLHGRLAYVPQAPFITNNPVRENIIFGRWVLGVRVWGGGA